MLFTIEMEIKMYSTTFLGCLRSKSQPTNNQIMSKPRAMFLYMKDNAKPKAAITNHNSRVNDKVNA